MKQRQKAVWFLSGVLVTVMAISIVSPTLALFTKTIQVQTGVNFYVDDKKLTPKKADGTPIEAFLYNGTTYLPVRAVSEALNIPIQWDGSTKSVYIGKHTGDKPAAWLAQLDYFHTTFFNRYFDKSTTDNLGKEHNHSIYFTDGNYAHGTITYKVNGQYSQLTGLYYQRYDSRNGLSQLKTNLTIYADGQTIWNGTVSGGIDPVEINVNIAGTSELKLELDGYISYVAIGELGLWT